MSEKQDTTKYPLPKPIMEKNQGNGQQEKPQFATDELSDDLMEREEIAFMARCDISDFRKFILTAGDFTDETNVVFKTDGLYSQALDGSGVSCGIFRYGAENFGFWYMNPEFQKITTGLNIAEIAATSRKNTSQCTVIMYVKESAPNLFTIEFHNITDCTFVAIDHRVLNLEIETMDIPEGNFKISMLLPTGKYKETMDQLSFLENVYLSLMIVGLCTMESKA